MIDSSLDKQAERALLEALPMNAKVHLLLAAGWTFWNCGGIFDPVWRDDGRASFIPPEDTTRVMPDYPGQLARRAGVKTSIVSINEAWLLYLKDLGL